MLIHEKEILITEEFIDFNNHVNNVQYVNWVEMMAAEHWDLRKHKSVHKNEIWFLHEHNIQYKKQVFLGDTLLMRTYPMKPVGVKQPRKVEFYKHGELVVDSLTHWILLDHQTQKIIRLDENWLETLV